MITFITLSGHGLSFNLPADSPSFNSTPSTSVAIATLPETPELVDSPGESNLLYTKNNIDQIRATSCQRNCKKGWTILRKCMGTELSSRRLCLCSHNSSFRQHVILCKRYCRTREYHRFDATFAPFVKACNIYLPKSVYE